MYVSGFYSLHSAQTAIDDLYYPYLNTNLKMKKTKSHLFPQMVEVFTNSTNADFRHHRNFKDMIVRTR